MDDQISRQAAIDAYGDWYVEEGTEEGFIGTVKQLLEGLPPAQPEPHWIPVSERLPEERDWYLGIFKEPDTGWINPTPFICDYLLGTKTKATTKEGWILKGHTDREEYIDYYFNLECVAWMPLPEPYKEGDNMNADGTLDQEEMHKALKLNPYLRDVCGVPFRDSLGLAMLIVANWDGIKSRVEGQEGK